MPSRKRKLAEVIKEEAEEEASYICDVCGQMFQRGCGLASHMRTHASTEVTCGKCNFTCKSKLSYARHMQTKHGAKPDQPETVSDDAGSLNTSSDDMPVLEPETDTYRERRSIPTHRFSERKRTLSPPPILEEEIAYSCPICHKRFETKTRMTYHFQNHRKRNWLIPKKAKSDYKQIGQEKNYGFNTGSKLVVKWRLNCESRPISLRRAQLWYFMEENFGCPLDKEIVSTQQNTKTQRNSRTQPGNSTRQSVSSPTTKQSTPVGNRTSLRMKKLRMKGGIAFGQMLCIGQKKFYLCRGCPYVSWNLSSLWRHARHHIHSSKLSFTCVACSYSSIYLENIKHHVKVHKKVTEVNREYHDWLLYERKMNKPDFSGALGDEIDTVAVPKKKLPATSKIVIASRRTKTKSRGKPFTSKPPELFHKDQFIYNETSVRLSSASPKSSGGKSPPVLQPMYAIPSTSKATPAVPISTRPVRIITSTLRAVESAEQANAALLKYGRASTTSLKSGQLPTQRSAQSGSVSAKSNKSAVLTPPIRTGPPPSKLARGNNQTTFEIDSAVTSTEIRWPPLLSELSKEPDFDKETGTFRTVLKSRATSDAPLFSLSLKNANSLKTTSQKSKDTPTIPKQGSLLQLKSESKTKDNSFSTATTCRPAKVQSNSQKSKDVQVFSKVSHQTQPSRDVSKVSLTMDLKTVSRPMSQEFEEASKQQKSKDAHKNSTVPKHGNTPQSVLEKLKSAPANTISATSTMKDTGKTSTTGKRQPAAPISKPIATAKLACKIVKEARSVQAALKDASLAQPLARLTTEACVVQSTMKFSRLPALSPASSKVGLAVPKVSRVSVKTLQTETSKPAAAEKAIRSSTTVSTETEPPASSAFKEPRFGPKVSMPTLQAQPSVAKGTSKSTATKQAFASVQLAKITHVSAVPLKSSDVIQSTVAVVKKSSDLAENSERTEQDSQANARTVLETAASKQSCSTGETSSTDPPVPLKTKKSSSVESSSSRVHAAKADPPVRRSARTIAMAAKAAELAAPPFKEPDVPFDVLYPAFSYKGSLKYQQDLKRMEERKNPKLRLLIPERPVNKLHLARMEKYLRENPDRPGLTAAEKYHGMVAAKWGLTIPGANDPPPPPQDPIRVAGPSRKKAKSEQVVQEEPQPRRPLLHSLISRFPMQCHDFQMGVARLHAREAEMRRQAYPAPPDTPIDQLQLRNEKQRAYLKIELEVERTGQCADCPFRDAKDLERLKRHRDKHHLNGPHKCSECNYSSHVRLDIEYHKQFDHFLKDVKALDGISSSESENSSPPPSPKPKKASNKRKRRGW